MNDCNRCGHCPVPEGLTCYHDAGMCRRAGEPGQEAFRTTLVTHARIRAERGEAGVEPSPLPASAEVLALLARMRKCPSFVPRSDCGCGVNECREGKGKDGQVSYQDCFACLGR